MFIVHCMCADDGDESFNDHEDGNGSKDNFREQDIYLPIANVARIMKNAIPQTGKVVAHAVFCVLCILNCSHVIGKPIKYQGVLTREKKNGLWKKGGMKRELRISKRNV